MFSPLLLILAVIAAIVLTLVASIAVLCLAFAPMAGRSLKPLDDVLPNDGPRDVPPPEKAENLLYRMFDREFGEYGVLSTPAGPSGPIFLTREGYGKWEQSGRPHLHGTAKPTLKAYDPMAGLAAG